MKRSVHIVTLGCPKNQIDSEVMAGILLREGYSLSSSPGDAETIIINTCAFIQPATEESIEEIVHLGNLKRRGSCRRLVVAGCLPQRYGFALEKLLPEADLFIGTAEFPRITEHLLSLDKVPALSCRTIVSEPDFLMNSLHPRHIEKGTATAYLKLADGCSNRCTYCIIPSIRGAYRSRTPDDVLSEAEQLAGKGVKEIILTAQDTTAYGTDNGAKPTLAGLLKNLASIKTIQWIRILYGHPRHITDDLIETMGENDKICPYMDIPIQHIDDPILHAMNRHITETDIRRAIGRLRSRVPDIALRTSIIVGFPGEGRRSFQKLLDFLRETRFDHLGVFEYCREEGTPAWSFDRRISKKERHRRRAVLMEEQAAISSEIMKEAIGSVQQVLIEGPSDMEGYPLAGRTARQAPDIDGLVYVNAPGRGPGDMIQCRITSSDIYDLFGEECS